MFNTAGFQSIRVIDIMQKVTDEEIFEFYLERPSEGARYCSPFRPNDSKPDCRFNMYNGKWYFIDNATYRGKLHFNCFEFVQYSENISFYSALKVIWSDMGLGGKPIKRIVKDVSEVVQTKFDCIIKFTHKPWNEINYFTDLGIPKSFLDLQPYYSVDDYWVNTKSNHGLIRNRFGKYSDIIAYYFKDTDRTKLRFPDGDIFLKWHSNATTEDIFGYHRMGDYLESKETTLVITKSAKDELVIHYHSMGLPTVALQSETGNLPDKVLNILKYFKRVYIVYDNDKVGHTKSKELMFNINSHFPRLSRRIFFNNDDSSTEYLTDQNSFFKKLQTLKNE